MEEVRRYIIVPYVFSFFCILISIRYLRCFFIGDILYFEDFTTNTERGNITHDKYIKYTPVIRK